MADEVATDFISKMKARGRSALDWFKKIARQTQRAVTPARSSRREILDDRNTGVVTTPLIGGLYLFQYDAKRSCHGGICGHLYFHLIMQKVDSME